MITGTNSTGIAGLSTSGTLELRNYGNVTGTNTGSFGMTAATSGFAYALHFSGTIDVQGGNSVGILVESSNDSAGVTVYGEVKALGAGSDGISAIGGGAGASVVFINGSVTVADTGVNLSSPNIMSITVGTGGQLFSGGIAVNTSGAGATFFQNRGTVYAQGTSEALKFVGAANSSSQNYGTIIGSTILSNGNDIFDNVGSFYLRYGDFDFGAGAVHTLNNSGYFYFDEFMAGAESLSILGSVAFNHSGLLSLADADVGAASEVLDHLTIDGNFNGSGGAIHLDTVLNGDGSDSDVVTITGDVTGNSKVFITNVGGLGAETVGNGILVIDVVGASAAGAFAMGAPTVAGKYLYDLILQGDGKWYLTPKIADVGYEADAITQLDSWNAGLDGLGKRLEDLHNRKRSDNQEASLGAADFPQTAIKPGADDGEIDGFWLRGFGQGADIEGDRTYDSQILGTQIGYDHAWMDAIEEDDLLVFGGFVGMQSNDVTFQNLGTETVDLTSYSFGLYATYLQGPLFLEGIVKLDVANVTHEAELTASIFEYSNPTYGASIEGGYRFEMSDSFFVEPQAQLSFAHMSSVSGTDSIGLAVEIDEASSLRGRLGAKAGKTFELDGGRVTPFLSASVVQEFLGDSSASMSGLVKDEDIGGTSYKVGFGVDAIALASHISVHANVDLLLGQTEGVSGSLGLRFDW